MKTNTWLAVAVAIATAMPIAAHAQANSTAADIKKHPGYVDFDPEALFPGKTPTVQVNLDGPLLNAMMGTVKESDKELSGMIKSIALVRVYVYENLGEAGAQASEKVQALVKTLEGGGWTRAVSVNDGAEVVRVMTKLDGEKLAGITVVVFDPAGEIVFANIVGSMSPDQIGQLMSMVGDGEFAFPGLGDLDPDLDKSVAPEAPKAPGDAKEPAAPAPPANP